MKKDILINVGNYSLNLITNGAENFDNIVLCFHGFNGDKWGDAYSGLKKRLDNSLVASFDACGHGDSVVSSEDMRLNIVLEEIDAVVNYFRQVEPNTPLIFVACSYGAYRVMQYLINYKPEIRKVVYVNPAFEMLDVLEMTKNFKYNELKAGDKIAMKSSLNKFISKEFLDDLYNNNLYSQNYDLNYDSCVVVGKKDSLIPISDKLEIADRYNYKVVYVDDEHCFENKDNWDVVVDCIKENKWKI